MASKRDGAMMPYFHSRNTRMQGRPGYMVGLLPLLLKDKGSKPMKNAAQFSVQKRNNPNSVA